MLLPTSSGLFWDIVISRAVMASDSGMGGVGNWCNLCDTAGEVQIYDINPTASSNAIRLACLIV